LREDFNDIAHYLQNTGCELVTKTTYVITLYCAHARTTTLQARETYDAARQVSVSVTTGESQALLNVTVISARHVPRAARRAAADTYVTVQLLCGADATTAADIGSGSGAYSSSSSSRRRRSSANSSSSSTMSTTSAATTVRADTLYPEWRESFELKPVPNRKQTRLGVSLMDAITGTVIGSSTFPLSDPTLTAAKPVTIWLDLQTPDSSTAGLLKSANRACRLPDGCAVKCELQLRCNAGLAAAAAVAKLAAAVRCEASAVAARRDYEASLQQQQQCEVEVCSDVSSQLSDARSDARKELFIDSAAGVAASSACDTAEQQQLQQHALLQECGEENVSQQHASVSGDSSVSPQVLEAVEHCSTAAGSDLAQQQEQQQHEAVEAEITPVRSSRRRPHSASTYRHRNSVSSSSSSNFTAAAVAAVSNGATAAVRSNGRSVSLKGARTPRAGTNNSSATNNDCSLDSSSSSYGSGSYNSAIFRSPAARWSKPAVAKRNSSSTADTVPWR
jgi:C2 domain